MYIAKNFHYRNSYFSTKISFNLFALASLRVMGLLQCLLGSEYKIHFICAGKKNKALLTDLQELPGVRMDSVDPNDLMAIEKLSNSYKYTPNLAIFDTFVSEEMFSNHVYQKYPDCLRVLDTQDYHSLRLARQRKLEEEGELNLDVLNAIPETKSDEYYARELASFYRSDLVLFCSDYEKQLAEQLYDLPATGLATFFYQDSDIDSKRKKGFNRRKNFAWIGNFAHPPNYEAVNWLIRDLWPQISEKLPGVELHIYGANFLKEITELESETVKCRGLMKETSSLSNYRALLAPIRFGAGIKGKITDSWAAATPVVTTPIGSEGLYLETYNNNYDYKLDDPQFDKHDPTFSKINARLLDFYKYNSIKEGIEDKLTFGGSFNNIDEQSYIDSAIRMYTDEAYWYDCSDKGLKIIKERMKFEANHNIFKRAIAEAEFVRQTNKKQQNIKSLVWSETLRSHDKLAKYINEKNKNKSPKSH